MKVYLTSIDGFTHVITEDGKEIRNITKLSYEETGDGRKVLNLEFEHFSIESGLLEVTDVKHNHQCNICGAHLILDKEVIKTG